MPSRLAASDSIQRPLSFVTQCWIVAGHSQRLQGCLCLWPDASQRPGRADAHVEEFILQSFDQLRHSGLRGRADARQGLTCRPSDAGNRIAHGSCQVLGRLGGLRTDGCQSLRRVQADVWFPVRESLVQSGYRRSGPLAQGAQGTRGIARDKRIRVAQCPSQRRLYPFGIGCQVDQDIDGASPDGGSIIPKHVRQHRNGRRTDTADDFRSLQMQVSIATVQESSQQGQRTPCPLDQGGFGGCPNLRVVGHHAICPVKRQGRIPGKIRLCRKRQLPGRSGGVP